MQEVFQGNVISSFSIRRKSSGEGEGKAEESGDGGMVGEEMEAEVSMGVMQEGDKGRGGRERLAEW